MSHQSTQERRLILRLMSYWHNVRGGHTYPPPEAIDPKAIGRDWDSCFIIQIADPLAASYLTHIGVEIPGNRFMTPGTRIEAIPEEMLLRQALKSLSTVLDKRTPISLGGQTEAEGRPMLHRNVLLPLSEDGDTIDQVLGALTSKHAETS